MSDLVLLQSAISLYQRGADSQARGLLTTLAAGRQYREPARFYLGLLEMRAGAFQAALGHFDVAAKLNRTKPEYPFNKAICLAELGRYGEALNILGPLSQALPNAVPVLFNKAVLLGKLGRKAEEQALYERVLQLDPGHPDSLNNLAVCLNERENYADALAVVDRLLALDPSHEAGLKTRSDILQNLGCADEAAEGLEAYLDGLLHQQRLASAAHAFCKAACALIRLPAIYASTAELNSTRQAAIRAIEGMRRLAPELRNLPAAERVIVLGVLLRTNLFYLAYQQEDDRDCHAAFSAAIADVLDGYLPPYAVTPRTRAKKIRLGVLSRFKFHVDTDVLAWLEQLPRDHYEFVFIKLNAREDEALDAHLRRLGELHSVRVDETSLAEAVTRIRALRLDALFMQDVGMTTDGKLLANVRLAPWQFTNWSHPVTTGSRQMDAYLSGQLMEPPDAASHYTESLVMLPHLGLYVPRYASTANVSSGGGEAGAGEFRVGCIQALFKYLPRDDDLFVDVCKMVPEARLIFIEDAKQTTTARFAARLRALFSRHGLEFDRHVEIMPRMTQDAFFSMIAGLDLCLDSVGWSGGNTSLQALHQGKLIVTTAGRFMRGRHTSAMLERLGLTAELVAHDKAGVVQRILHYRENPSARAEVETAIRARVDQLFGDREVIGAIDQFLRRVDKE